MGTSSGCEGRFKTLVTSPIETVVSSSFFHRTAEVLKSLHEGLTALLASKIRFSTLTLASISAPATMVMMCGIVATDNAVPPHPFLPKGLRR